MRKTFNPLANPSHSIALVLTVAFVLAGAIPGVQPRVASADAQAPRADGSPTLVEDSATAEIVWIRQFGTPAEDVASRIAADSAAVYVAGRTAGALPDQTNTGDSDIFVRKYDLGGSEVWTRQFGSSGSDWPSAVTLDASGLYVAAHIADIGAILRKYDQEGHELWTQSVRAADLFRVAVQASDVYVGGEAYTRNGDMFVGKFGVGGTEIWTRVFGTSERERGTIAVDASGVYVVGDTLGALPGQTNLGGSDMFIRKYDANGNELWTRQFGTTSDEYFFGGVALDAFGVYVAPVTPFVATIRKYDANGNELWTRGFEAVPLEIAVDATGVFVVGNKEDTSPRPFVRRYDFDGNETWTRQAEFYGRAEGAAIDASGLYVAGHRGQGNFGIFVLKYSVTGDLVWNLGMDGQFWGVAAEGGQVYLAGLMDKAFRCLVNAGGYDAFVARLAQDPLNRPPILGTIDAAPAAAFPAQEVVFSVCSWDPDGDVLAYAWDFGDGTRATGTTPGGGGPVTTVHRWTVEGVYTVAMTIEDANGSSSSQSIQMTVSSPNAAPTVSSISASPVVAIAGQDVTYAATAADPDGDVMTFAWSFGDGTTATGTTAAGGGTISGTRAYSAASTYAVTLSVDDGRGGTATKSATVRVVTPLSLDFSAEPISGTVPLIVSFAASPSGGVAPYSFAWDFGDGGSSMDQNPTHTYEVAGTYALSLAVTDAGGQTATKSILIHLDPSGTPWIPYAILAAVTAAAVIGIMAVLLLRRSRKGPPPRVI